MNAVKRWLIRREVVNFLDRKIQESNMSPTTKSWLIGLLNAAISTLATTLGTQVAGTSWKQTLVADAFTLAISLSKWIYQHPIPGGIND